MGLGSREQLSVDDDVSWVVVFTREKKEGERLVPNVPAPAKRP